MRWMAGCTHGHGCGAPNLFICLISPEWKRLSLALGGAGFQRFRGGIGRIPGDFRLGFTPVLGVHQGVRWGGTACDILGCSPVSLYSTELCPLCLPQQVRVHAETQALCGINPHRMFPLKRSNLKVVLQLPRDLVTKHHMQ